MHQGLMGHILLLEIMLIEAKAVVLAVAVVLLTILLAVAVAVFCREQEVALLVRLVVVQEILDIL